MEHSGEHPPRDHAGGHVLILSVIEDLELAHALGATDLMHKPAKPQELLETIERLIAAN